MKRTNLWGGRPQIWPSGLLIACLVALIAGESALAQQFGPGGPGGPGGAASRLQPNFAPAVPRKKFSGDYTGDGTPVAEIRIEGNQAINSSLILSKLRLIKGRPYRQDMVSEDVRTLYATHWFYDVKPVRSDSPEGVVVTYHVIERPTVHKVMFNGNKSIKLKKLQEITGLKAGRPMDPGLNNMMARRIEDEYHKKGFPFCKVDVVAGNSRGDKNVVFNITEGPKTKISSVTFEGVSFVSNARLHTQIKTKSKMGSFFLGGKYDRKIIENDTHTLTQYFRAFGYLDVKVGAQLDWNEAKDRVAVTFVVDEGPRYKVNSVTCEGNKVFDSELLCKNLKLTEGKEFSQAALKHDVKKIQDVYGEKGFINRTVHERIRYCEQPGLIDLVHTISEDTPKKIGQIKVVGNTTTKQSVIVSRTRLQPGQIANTNDIAYAQQALMGSRLFNVDPAQGVRPTVEFDPGNNPEDEFQDILIKVEEAPTGSILFGVGVNSDSGVGGSLVVHERNFDLFRFPRGFNDIGTAFRGGGQEFRMEAVPGSQVSRYSVSITEPKLLGMDYSLSSSGYFYRRIFTAYDEQRVGGRFSLGKRFNRNVGASMTFRLEDVKITDPVVPTPADLTAVLGHNFMSTVRFAVDHDTRDSHLAPSTGHFVELSFEQAFGDYDYSRFGIDGRQYFTVKERPDGSGKHIVTLRGQVGYSGDDTPLFERYFAGGFRTIRGFDFRGVGPVDLGVEVGGNFLLLGGVQYQLPVMPDDSFSMVFFVDSGTVESDFEIRDYRVTAGFGLRVKMPQFGPVPLAFDFAFPLADAETDDRQIFSFFLGAFY